jgi:flagellum-specific ATP synthase
MPDIVESSHMDSTRTLMELMSLYRNAEDLINLGAYRSGSNPRLDLAVAMMDPITQFLRQGIADRADLAASLQGLDQLVAQAQELGRG